MFFNKRNKPEPPTLLGEDFDIYPDLGERKNKTPDTMEQEEPDDDPGPTDFQQKIADIPEDKFKKLQILIGIGLGIVSSACLTVVNLLLPNNLGFYVALLLALVLPNIFEKQAARKIPKLRIYLVITLAVFLGIYLIYGLVFSPELFFSSET